MVPFFPRCKSLIFCEKEPSAIDTVEIKGVCLSEAKILAGLFSGGLYTEELGELFAKNQTTLMSLFKVLKSM